MRRLFVFLFASAFIFSLRLSTGSPVFAQSCGNVGDPCYSGSCCSPLICSSFNICINNTALPTQPPACRINGEVCELSSQCCSKFCSFDLGTGHCIDNASPPTPVPNCKLYENIGSCVGFLVCPNNPDYCCTTLAGCNTLPPQIADVFCDSTKSTIKTAFGCAPVEGHQLLNLLLRWGVIIGGGIALLLIGYSGIQIITASGDPKKMKAGQELLVSALTGLLLIALAIVIINFLGKTVLNLPEFRV